MDSVIIYPSIRSLGFSVSICRTNCLSYYPFSFFKRSGIKKLERSSSISVSLNPNSKSQKPSSPCGRYKLPIKPFSVLISNLQTMGLFAAITPKPHWVSAVKQQGSSEKIPDVFEGNYRQNGGLGMALLSVTSTAKVKISPFVVALAANRTFVAGLFAGVIAQLMKVFLHFFFEKKWDLRIMCASGGMPSSHSALCTAMTTSVAICHGVADSLFPVCLGFSLIVMYDAIGVRRHAGMQAEVLNLIVEDMFQGHPISKRKLKEILGHTPSQVVAGALLGILVACICCQGCLVGI